MRVREHLLISTTGAAVAAPWAGRSAIPALAASVLIDVDHYLWFVITGKGISLGSALHYFNGANAPNHASTRVFHHPAFLLAFGICATRRSELRPLVVGMAFHVALDRHHRRRVRRAQLAALRRDGSRCQRCGRGGPNITVHQGQAGLLLLSPRPAQMITLCAECHSAAHRDTVTVDKGAWILGRGLEGATLGGGSSSGA